MSSISDEIRKWCDFYYERPTYKGDFEKLRDLADRIDAEMVELPRDANDEPILPGDTVYLEDGRMALVTEISIKRDWIAIDCRDGSKHVTYDPSGITHVRPDSWERIAHDLDDWTAVLADCDVDAAHEFADRIRKLADCSRGE